MSRAPSPITAAPTPPSGPVPRPDRGLLAAAGAALLAHAWLLLGWPEREPRPLHSAPLLLSVREAPAADRAPPVATRPRDARPRPAPIARPGEAAPEAVTPAPPLPAPAEAAPPARPDPDVAGDAEAPPAVGAPDLAAVPPLGEGVWRYRLRQAGEEGVAVLRWQSRPQGYELTLRRRLPSHPLPGWRSEGGRDALGLAPQRFAVLRGPREVQALNFRRDQGLISYSASTELQPLAPATQDRLSWWLQLPALLQAWQAQRGTPLAGQRFEIPVALIRGGLHRWQFSVLGQEAGLWHLQRGALGPFDARLDVWLDPARQFLPVRLHQQIGDEEGWEMELQDELSGPEPAAAA